MPIPVPIRSPSQFPQRRRAHRPAADVAIRRPAILHQLLFTVVLAFGIAGTSICPRAAPSPTNTLTRLLETAGKVELAHATTNAWRTAHPGDALAPGDRLRTHAASRATLQLSDRSILRVDQLTTLEIQPPAQPAAKARFRLNLGKLFFLDREKPADVEFDTPLAAGAIRGTEFLLEVSPADGTTRLALLDGQVDLSTANQRLEVRSGENVLIPPTGPPQKTALVQAIHHLQWALYYPAVVAPRDLQLPPEDLAPLQPALTAYSEGRLLDARSLLPNTSEYRSPNARLFAAALGLCVGRADECQAELDRNATQSPAARALRELIATIHGEPVPLDTPPATASEWLARSYTLQSRHQLPAARNAAQQATQLAPTFGFAFARLAELEFSLGNERPARRALDTAERLVPGNPLVPALRGFADLDRNRPRRAQAAFDQAIALDPAFGPGWLGRGIVALARGHTAEGERFLQAAAALEPQRALFRSHLAKAYAQQGHQDLQQREFDLARRLDPNDPTPWLYSALAASQSHHPNTAVRDLQTSRNLNDGQSLFRSRLLLDRDHAIRSANLATLYNDVGLADLGRHTAAAAVADDPTEFASHLFLAHAYQSLEAPNRLDLRFEAARHSEWLVANLLAPPGAGNLSQFLAPQDRLRYFGTRPFGLSSLTEYTSRGDWTQSLTAFGAYEGLSYALDGQYRNARGDWPNQKLEERYLAAQLKDQLTDQDAIYFQIGALSLNAGDVARHRSPSEVNPDFSVDERQLPFLYAGWHREWSPGNHTLFLAARLDDHLERTDPQFDQLFLRYSAGAPAALEAAPLFALDATREFALYAAELQHLWHADHHTLTLGARWQHAEPESDARLSRALSGTVTDQSVAPDFDRLSAYAYAQWRPIAPLRLIAGLSYDRIQYPENLDLAPISPNDTERDLLAPKLALLWSPTDRTLVRAAWTRSLSGSFFDTSIRLEPAQLAGFTQALRSLAPESIVGLVPGTRFETVGVGLDHAFSHGTYLGVDAEWLRSDATRTIGVLTNATPLPLPDAAASLRQSLDFDERTLSAYARQLLGESWSLGLRYAVSRAHLDARFPSLPATLPGVAPLTGDDTARLHHLQLDVHYQHPCGFFAAWLSEWHHQLDDADARPEQQENFWQHHLWIGYRLPQRRAEFRLGLLNLTDQDYRLYPLNLHAPLPRDRTLTATLKLHF